MSGDEPYRYAVWTAEWAGGLAAEVGGRDHHLRVDEPPEFGGEDTGPMPTELMVASIASCFCLAVAWAARKRRVTLDDLKVHVRAERAEGEPRHGAYDVWVESSTPAADLGPAIEIAVARWQQLRALDEQVQGLRERQEARAVVDRAKRLLEDRLGIGEAEAFAWLRRAAMDRRLTLAEVAAQVVAETG